MKNIVCSYTLSMSDDVFESLCEELDVSSEAEVVAFYKGLISSQVARLDSEIVNLTDFSVEIQDQSEEEGYLN